MELVCLGWPPDGPTLDLDHESMPYAGKFVTGRTGKAVARVEDGTVLGATAFNEDYAADGVLRIRYVAVRYDCQGEGIGTALLRFTRDLGLDRGYDAVAVAVNNPYAFEAAVKAGFGYTGEQTGVAELRMRAPAPEPDRYREGLELYRERVLPEDALEFVAEKLVRGPPA